jgi:hypothetical protein
MANSAPAAMAGVSDSMGPVKPKIIPILTSSAIAAPESIAPVTRAKNTFLIGSLLLLFCCSQTKPGVAGINSTHTGQANTDTAPLSKKGLNIARKCLAEKPSGETGPTKLNRLHWILFNGAEHHT